MKTKGFKIIQRVSTTHTTYWLKHKSFEKEYQLFTTLGVKLDKETMLTMFRFREKFLRKHYIDFTLFQYLCKMRKVIFI